MKFVKAAVIGAILIAGAAFAEGDRTDPNAKARSDLMRIVGKNTGILGDMAGGKAAYDAAAAEAAKAAIVEAAGGSVTNLDGSPMVYGKAASRYLNGSFVARGDPAA